MTHVKNAESFSRLVAYCTGYGGTYNPGRQSLHIEMLVAQLNASRETMQQVIIAKSAFDNEVNQRRHVFAQLPALVSSVLRTLEASGASSEKLKDARAFARPITGYLPNRPVIIAGADEQPVKTVRSRSQRAYSSKTEAFAKLLEAVSTEPLYLTNEAHLSVAGLSEKMEALNNLNARVSEARVVWSNACIARNTAMYNSTQSLGTLLRAVKKYVRALFGHDSAQYAQVKVLSFIKPN